MSNTEAEIQSYVHRINRQFANGQYRPFISFIQFPNYKNFQQNLRVTFDFPLTVIAGQNGSGKTSLLHAMYGAPIQKSPSRYWFGTAIDPIPDGRNRYGTYERPAFWYEYVDARDGKTKQVLKTRIRRAGDPDYWESSRPIMKYGMRAIPQGKQKKSRSTPASMTPNYLNFKTMINAYDRCFYFAREDSYFLKRLEKTKSWIREQDKLTKTRKRPPRVQDYIRVRSRGLRKALIEGKTVKYSNTIMNKDAVTLTNDELTHLNRIIGRTYVSGRLIEHRLYDGWGTSVLFRTDTLTYSEAFAGSGESVATRLIHEMYTSEPGGLFLLDEPETSLHPRAQREMLAFLLQQIAEKRHQVIISTHSPCFVRSLPPDAIRVFTENNDGKVCIGECESEEDAFFVLGHPAEHQTAIIVEDALCQKLLEAVAKSIGEGFSKRVTIMALPGGASSMKERSVALALTDQHNYYFIFDGDQKTEIGPIDEDDLGFEPESSLVDNTIKSHLKMKMKFPQDSNMNERVKLEMRVKYIRYINKHFHALPYDCPESAIWDRDTAKLYLAGIDPNATMPDESLDAKSKFEYIARFLATNDRPVADEIMSVQNYFVSSFCNKPGNLTELKSLLRKVASNA